MWNFSSLSSVVQKLDGVCKITHSPLMWSDQSPPLIGLSQNSGHMSKRDELFGPAGTVTMESSTEEARMFGEKVKIYYSYCN